ncbi:MAG: preprotein translocase subunit SecE [Culicoidibacterales bacterium]
MTKTKKESFLAGVNKEIKKVKWPTGKEMLSQTGTVIGFVLFLMAFFLVVDSIISMGINLFIN